MSMRIWLIVLAIIPALILGIFCGYYIAQNGLWSIPEPPPRVYIALGDSVSTGFGVDSADRYTTLFFDKLVEDDYADEYINMAVNGNTTTSLLSSLYNMDEYCLDYFRNAEVITVNIGGNNVLAPFLAHMPSTDEMLEIINEALEFASESKDMADEIMDVISEVRNIMENASVIEAIAFLTSIRKTFSTLQDTVELFQRASDLEVFELASFLLEPLPAEIEDDMDKGVNAFEDEFIKIINWLEENAPDAVIIVNTVYNPIPQDFLGSSIESYDAVNSQILSMNNIIQRESQAKGFLVSDVYTRFNKEDSVLDLMNFGMDMSALIFSFDFIHPNKEGHKIIAELNYDSFSSVSVTT